MTDSDIDARAALLARAAEGNHRHYLQGYFDHGGQLRSKLVHGEHLASALADDGPMHIGVFTTAVDGSIIPDGEFSNPQAEFQDATLRLDPTSARRYPLAAGEPWLVLGELTGRYRPWCVRALLRDELARLEAHGFAVKSALEFELKLLDETPESLRRTVPEAVRVAPGYRQYISFVDQGVAMPLYDELFAHAETMGLPIASLHIEHEDLLEVALAPAMGLTGPDNAGLFKGLMKLTARRQGRMACFMARLNDGSHGCSGHLNLSLHDASGEPAFVDAAKPDALSDTLRHFVGGLRRYLPQLMLALAPNVNSYRRFVPGLLTPLSNSWGINNKTVAFRIANASPATTRVEVRLPGADVNAHLALLATLAAGRLGIEQRLDPGAATVGDAWAQGPTAGMAGVPALPLTFDTALEAFESSALAKSVFGQPFVDSFLTSRRYQRDRWQATITDWELRFFAEGA